MLLDHFIMTFLCAVPVVIGILIIKDGRMIPIGFAIGFAFYFCKDCINGQSFAKRILKLQVVDNTSGEAASPLKCVIRNIFISVWPLEVLVTLISPSRRMGDFLAGTRVITIPSSYEHTDTDWVQLFVAFLAACICSGFLTWFLFSITH